MKKSSKLIIAVVAFVLVALSAFGYSSFKKEASSEFGTTQISSLSEEQVDQLIEKVGLETYNSSEYTFYSYVGAHKNLFEVKDETNLTAIKVSFDYVMGGEETVMVFAPTLEYASLINGKIEELMEPEYDYDENGLVITSRIKHEVPSDGETYKKIDNVVIHIEL